MIGWKTRSRGRCAKSSPHPAIDADDRAGRVAGRIAGEVERCADDLIGLTERFSPTAFLNSSLSRQAPETSVRNGPGAMQLTRTFGANALASATVIALIAALAPE